MVLWKEYIVEHKDDDLLDITVAAVEMKEKKKQVSQNGKPENLSDVEQVACFEEAEKVEAENAGLSIFNSINIKSTNIYDDDMEYHSLQLLFVKVGGEQIKRHDIHYKKYKEALQVIGNYKQMKELAQKYFAACQNGYHSTPQIVWFLSDGWRNFITPVVTKMTRKTTVSKMPIAFELAQQETAAGLEKPISAEELASRYEDIQATLKFLRSTEHSVIQNKRT